MNYPSAPALCVLGPPRCVYESRIDPVVDQEGSVHVLHLLPHLEDQRSVPAIEPDDDWESVLLLEFPYLVELVPRDAERLLDECNLPRLDRLGEHGIMQIVRRGYHDRVQTGIRERLTVVAGIALEPVPLRH